MSRALSSAAAFAQKKRLEGPSEFCVEDGVDDRIHEGVHVANPGSIEERTKPDLTVGGIKLHTDSIQDVYSKKRNPTNKEDT